MPKVKLVKSKTCYFLMTLSKLRDKAQTKDTQEKKRNIDNKGKLTWFQIFGSKFPNIRSVNLLITTKNRLQILEAWN